MFKKQLLKNILQISLHTRGGSCGRWGVKKRPYFLKYRWKPLKIGWKSVKSVILTTKCRQLSRAVEKGVKPCQAPELEKAPGAVMCKSLKFHSSNTVLSLVLNRSPLQNFLSYYSIISRFIVVSESPFLSHWSHSSVSQVPL